MTQKIDVECGACKHVTSIVSGAPAFLCDGCRRWMPSAQGQVEPNEEAAAMERSRAWHAIKNDGKP